MLKNWLKVFMLFAKIALFSFGGGYAMLPMLQKELVDKQNWLSQDELVDFFALAQFQPGPIAINIAVLITTSRYGAIAGIVAALGIAFPSIILILTLAILLENFIHLPAITHALAGIKIAVAALVIYSAWGFIKSGVKDIVTFIIFAAALILLLLDILNPILIILLAAIAGILRGIYKVHKEDKA
jgi:chromate transporter